MASELEIEAPAAAAPSDGVVIGRYRATILETFRDTWRERHLLRLFGIFAIRRMFHGTLLGLYWIPLAVAVDIGGKVFLFGSVLSVRTPNGVPYVVFLLAGLLGWRLFHETVNFGVRSFQYFRKYALNFHFPLAIVPVANSARALVHFVAYLAVVGAGLGYYAARGVVYLETSAQLLFVPLGLLLCVVFGWGLTFFLAPLNYRARDVRFIVRAVLPLWMYLTPVVYPLDRLDGPLLLLAKLNPMAPIVEMIKFGLIGGGSVGPEFAAYGVASALGTFLAGLLFLNAFGPRLLSSQAAAVADEDDEDDVAASAV